MEGKYESLQVEEAALNAVMPWQKQLLVTKFYMPVASGPLISRSRLTTLLQRSLKYPFTLVSAPAGFGKTTLLSTWIQSLSAPHPLVAWISLDEEDNDPQIFWTYVLSALQRQHPQRFTPLLMQLQSSQPPPLKHLLTALLNLLVEATEHFVLILDDYHLITEQQVHSSLFYLLKNLTHQLHIILSTRNDPPLPFLQLRVSEKMLEVRTDQLRCITAETRAFFKEVIGIQLSDEIIQEVTARTEGWLVGLQLLGLSLPERSDPLTLLQEASGSQRYILDYLTEVVLRQQPQEVQRFLLCTCILEQLSAPLCDAVLQQIDSQQMLQRLEQANVFVVSLDSKQQWYRYHTLFAEALRYQLEQTQPDLIPMLHYRASLWYAQHDQATQAILHALHAKEWQWVADLIEREHLPLISYTWGASKHKLVLLRQWLEQLPAGLLCSRSHLCLTCIQMLYSVTPHPMLQSWLDTAEAMLTAPFTKPPHAEDSSPSYLWQARQEQQDLLGEVFTLRAFLWSYVEDGRGSLALSEQALTLLSAENSSIRVQIALARLMAYYSSSANDAVAAVDSGLQGASLAQAAGQTARAIIMMGTTAPYMLGAGRLHEAHQLTQQAILLGTKQGELVLPEVGYPELFQADILREWNHLDAAYALAHKGVELCEQTELVTSLVYLLCGYAVLIRVCLSRRDFDEVHSVCEQFHQIGMLMNQHLYQHIRSLLATVDQVRFWLVCGERDRATRWAQDLDHGERTPFAREREEVAYVRVLLAKDQPMLALQRLKPVLQRATAGKRWGHVIEIRLLQALAHQIHQQEKQALDALSEAVQLAEPEGYIRSFVDEGTSMAVLLAKLRKQQRQHGPTPYLDTLFAAFAQQSNEHEGQPKSMVGCTKAQPLLEPLSERELEVLQLLAQGASNREIAQELVIALDTVKRHVSHIFSKLGVNNRIQAIKQAQELSLLSREARNQ